MKHAEEMKRAEEIFEKYNLIFLLPIVGAFLFSRLFYAGEISYFMHTDELEQSYEALCIALFKTDSTGSAPSVFFDGLGNGHSALFILLGALAVKLKSGVFSIRLFRFIPALGGLIGLIFSYLYVWQQTGRKKNAFIAALLVLTLPLYFVSERCFAEDFLPLSILPPAFFFLLRGIKTSKVTAYFLSGLLFCTAMFASPSTLFVIPVFLLITQLYLVFIGKHSAVKDPEGSKPQQRIRLAHAAALCIPVFLCAGLLIFCSGLKEGYDVKNLASNLISIKRILWDDGHDFHVIPDFGTIYYLSIPLFVTGAVISLKKAGASVKTRAVDMNVPVWIFLLTALAFCLLKKEADIAASCLMLFPATLIITEGISYICENMKGAFLVVLTVYTLSFLVLCQFYFVNFNSELNHSADHEKGIIVDKSAGEAVKIALMQYPGNNITVFCGDFEGRNLLIALYGKASPEEYAGFSNEESFSFGNISVNPSTDNGLADNSVYITDREAYPELTESLKSSGLTEVYLKEYSLFVPNGQ